MLALMKHVSICKRGVVMAIIAKRTVMSLYSDSDDVYSYQVRMVLAVKGVTVVIVSNWLSQAR